MFPMFLHESRTVFEDLGKAATILEPFRYFLGHVLSNDIFHVPPEGILAPNASKKGGRRPLLRWFLCDNNNVSSICVLSTKVPQKSSPKRPGDGFG